MNNLDEKLSALADRVLKRPLADEERLEIFQIADAVGMRDVQSFLHLLLVFKLHEDTMSKRFQAMADLGRQIHESLESSVDRILEDGSRRIGAEMGEEIANRAEDVLTAVGDYRSVRAQLMTACALCVTAALAYWLGTGNVLTTARGIGPVGTLLSLPAGWCVFFCASVWSFLWAGDHWKKVRRSWAYKALFAGQIAALIALVIALW
jgi:hypothetical protein